mmetsp:Transcript_17475/g.25673  ORF Transcript_17475/g.25673 Transcript_17475/m.25673 type:complete len:419 (+) Transcript_17475:260-1516(+)|eukprot:CAMPEP_0195530618 /NCGR_PEP_ID=MMETSP0794_2-20130614/33586_1 /TAXON_ID=515487 /ORGANISM="Stephanopyxis turris, Strain CCMP 815" /LENGTH=418 /DNA_ID=CAMNT_0040662167 /DNA_START=260 /DNA_END=1516 /DNA_ORIENTATION=-
MGSAHGVLSARSGADSPRSSRAGSARSRGDPSVWIPIGEILQRRHLRTGRRGRPLLSLRRPGASRVRRVGFSCSHCQHFVSDDMRRYRCNECPSYNLCNLCYPRRGAFHDGSHSFMAVMTAQPPNFLQILEDFAGTRASGGSGDRGGDDGDEMSTRFHCHYCHISFVLESSASSQTDVQCPRCRTGFVERMNSVQTSSMQRVDMMLAELQRAFRGALESGNSQTAILFAGLRGLNTSEPAPAPRRLLDRLEEFALEPAQVQASSSCVICMEDWSVGDKAVRLPCNHLFHKDCVVTWLSSRNSCPMCRKKLQRVTQRGAGTSPSGWQPALQPVFANITETAVQPLNSGANTADGDATDADNSNEGSDNGNDSDGSAGAASDGVSGSPLPVERVTSNPDPDWATDSTSRSGVLLGATQDV